MKLYLSLPQHERVLVERVRPLLEKSYADELSGRNLQKGFWEAFHVSSLWLPHLPANPVLWEITFQPAFDAPDFEVRMRDWIIVETPEAD